MTTTQQVYILGFVAVDIAPIKIKVKVEKK